MSCCAGTAWRSRSPTGPTHELTADFAYVRFHPGHRSRRGNYSKTEIAEWAKRIGEWAQSVDVYAYFNNDWEEFAPGNALSLRRMLGVEAAR